jgi:ribosomal protein L18
MCSLLKHIYAQLIDDVAVSWLPRPDDKDFEGSAQYRAAKKVGKAMRERAADKASRKRCMTAAALYITAVSRLWLRAPARAAWSCKEDTNGND